MPDILILRHGQTEWNLARRFQGAMDSPLTDLGVLHAKAQGRILAAHLAAHLDHRPAELILCSPQPRAVRTARIALSAIWARALPDDRLREISVGQWEGLCREEIAATHPLAQDDVFWWMDHAPNGEGHAAVAARVADLLGVISGPLQPADRPIVLVTHGITACHLRGQLLGLTLQQTAMLTSEQGVVYLLADGQEQVLRDPNSQLAFPAGHR